MLFRLDAFSPPRAVAAGSARPRRGGELARAPALLPILFAAAMLPGCATLAPEAGGRPPPPAAAAAPAAAGRQDPFAAFAATASPGAEAVLPLPGTGQAERVRLQRSYVAASGRECRELLIGSGMAERSALLCREEGGGWVPARPLLKGGAGATRP